MRARALYFIPLLLLGASRAAHADDPPAPARAATAPRTPAQAADEVLAALTAGDAAALSALGARVEPDAWLVAEELLQRAQPAAAAALARVAVGPDHERLPAYVAGWQPATEREALQVRLDQLSAALARSEFDAALAASGPAGELRDVVSVRIETGRARSLEGLRRAGEANLAFERAASAAESLGWLRRAAHMRYELARLAYGAGSLDLAQAGWERLLALEQRRGNEFGIGRTLCNLGQVYLAREEFGRARELYQRGIDILERLGEAGALGDALLGLGGAQQGLRDYAAAVATYGRGLKIHEARRSASGIAIALSNLGGAERGMGRYARALEHSERALAAFEALKDGRQSARVLMNLAILHGDLGDRETAIALHRRALAGSQAVGDARGVAAAWAALAATLAEAGEREQALEAFERARAAHEALGNRIAVARIAGNLGNLHLEAGRAAEALEHLERALADCEASGDREASAWLRTSVASAFARLGRRAEALEAVKSAVRQLRSLRASPRLLSALTLLASLHLAGGEAAAALAAAREAVPLFEQQFTGLAEEQGAAARAEHAGLFAVGAAAAYEAGDAAELSQFLESGRAGTFLEALGSRQAMRWALVPASMRSRETSARAEVVAAHKALEAGRTAGDSALKEQLAQALAEARTRLQAITDGIERALKHDADVFYPRAAPLEQIQEQLAPAQALLLFALGPQEPLALVLTREEARMVKFAERAPLLEAVRELQVTRKDGTWEEAARALDARLIAPLALPPEASEVLVSLDGELSRVPFALLLPGRTVTHVASGSALVLALENPPALGVGTLALGDPDYSLPRDAAASRVVLGSSGGRGKRLMPLPATRGEAEAVGTSVLLGPEASEAGLARVLASSGRWHAIHFACHGLVNRDRPALSALALSPDPENDGYLTAFEVLAQGLPADLVVLSACETAQGKDVPAEGTLGLARAFTLAGASRVLCSLWKVDDDATAALMKEFYRLWAPRDATPGLAAAEALRQAQAHVRAQERWQHPYYWAAWVLWGQP